MRHSLLAVALLGTTLALAAPASAQQYRFDIGINGGGVFFTPTLDQEDIGATTDEEDGSFKSGWLTGAQLTLWLSQRIGLRANLAYTEQPFEYGDAEPHPVDDVNLWSASGDLMFRFRRPNDAWMGTEVLPYLALGVGAQIVNPAVDETFTDDEGETFEGVRFFTPPANPVNSFVMEEASSIMGLVALGADFRVAPNFALRLEVGDRFFDPKIHEVGLGTTPGQVPEEDVGSLTHGIYGTLGLHLLLGVQRPEVVAVAPPPPPPPAPRDTAPPPPAEQPVTVCVVDPSAPGGLRTVNASYRPATRDTVVMVEGTATPLRNTVGNVTVASGADWYVSGQPLAVTAGTRRVEFVTFGTARIIDANDLAFIGVVNGMPLYANRAEVETVRTELEEQARTGTELSRVIANRRNLRDAVMGLDVVYAPLQPVGCVFQPLQRQVEVRKGARGR